MSKYLADDVALCSGMGMLLFTRSNGPAGGAIRIVEGQECNHTAVVYWDSVRLEWRVAEMWWPRLRHMTLESWLIRYSSCVVGACQLSAPSQSLARFNDYILLKAYEQPRYALIDLVGFLAPLARRLNNKWGLVCSELAERASDYCQWRICPGQDIRTVSPQDQMRQAGKTLSVNLWGQQ